MAVAIGLDATLARLVLAPASMRLMGRWNWWHLASAQLGHPQGSAATRPADAGPRGGRRPSAGCQPRWARRTLLRWGVGHPRRPAAEAGFG